VFKLKILHVLANSPPDINGYAVRTQGLLHAYSKRDEYDIVGITSPWYPERESMVEPFEMDGVRYLRCPHPTWNHEIKGVQLKWVAKRGRQKINLNSTPKKKSFLRKAIRTFTMPVRVFFAWYEERILFNYFMNYIETTILSEQVDVIHAHTPYRVGLPALKMARKYRLPFIYEMRGLWEDSAVASGRWREGGLAYWRFRKMENILLQNSDKIVCISECLRNEAISRGVPFDKILVVPNAVHNIETISESNELFLDVKTKIGDKFVVGYIGSLRKLEGVDLTAEAVSILREKGFEIEFFVLSSSQGQAELRRYCHDLGIGDLSTIIGPVEHKDVAQFYGLIDVFVVSRPDTRVTRLVTPLKPFEAMYQGCPVVVSNLPALSEIIEHGTTGLHFQVGNAHALAETIAELSNDPERRLELGRNGKHWVEENRTWERVIDAIHKNYI
jgi:glycosyltransferase involved in cell wall biosynthesis